MNAFVTHPSVRIKGTENNYEPVQCFDHVCPNKTPHMHCPFCVKTDSYNDPVILKAHYRVKHVDKGIDFAGLKVLRCCDQCDIVGTIKGQKEFKGAHWHCYKCKNGFNRRDEALKHYRTHFRNPQTTFQIQVTQEVNQPFNMQLVEETEAASDTLSHSHLTGIHPALTEAVMSATGHYVQPGEMTTITLANGKSPPDTEAVQVSVAANETVGTSEGQTIMIIQEEDFERMEAAHSQVALDQSETNTIHINQSEANTIHINQAEANTIHIHQSEASPIHVNQSEAMHVNHSESNTIHIAHLESVNGVPGDSDENEQDHVVELEQQVSDLRAKVSELEVETSQAQLEIKQLKLQIHLQEDEIQNCQKREEELLKQMAAPLEESQVQEMLAQMRAAHEELLQQQLTQIKRHYLAQLVCSTSSSSSIVSIGSTVDVSSNLNPTTVMLVPASSS